MLQDEMRQVTGLGPEWRLIWLGEHALPDQEHVCLGPGASSCLERFSFRRTRRPSIEIATCARCRTAWVREVKL